MDYKSTIAMKHVNVMDRVEPARAPVVPAAPMIFITYDKSPYIRVVDCARGMTKR